MSHNDEMLFFSYL
jgi:hypothetical protein